MTPKTRAERFWAKVPVRSPWPEDCWEWTASKNKGYGQFGNGWKKPPIGAQVWVWRFMGGEIPEGMQIDHACRNPACVRPGHLNLVSRAYNEAQGRATRNAMWRSRTHCRRMGHELSGANLGRQGPDGRWRYCVACKKETNRQYQDKYGSMPR